MYATPYNRSCLKFQFFSAPLYRPKKIQSNDHATLEEDVDVCILSSNDLLLCKLPSAVLWSSDTLVGRGQYTAYIRDVQSDLKQPKGRQARRRGDC